MTVEFLVRLMQTDPGQLRSRRSDASVSRDALTDAFVHPRMATAFRELWDAAVAMQFRDIAAKVRRLGTWKWAWNVCVDLKRHPSVKGSGGLFNKVFLRLPMPEHVRDQSWRPTCMGVETMDCLVGSIGDDVDALRHWLEFRPMAEPEMVMAWISFRTQGHVRTASHVFRIIHQAFPDGPRRRREEPKTKMTGGQPEDRLVMCDPPECPCECPVCRSDGSSSSSVWKTRSGCDHPLCGDCYDSWIKACEAAKFAPTCPMCRAPVTASVDG